MGVVLTERVRNGQVHLRTGRFCREGAQRLGQVDPFRLSKLCDNRADILKGDLGQVASRGDRLLRLRYGRARSDLEVNAQCGQAMTDDVVQLASDPEAFGKPTVLLEQRASSALTRKHVGDEESQQLKAEVRRNEKQCGARRPVDGNGGSQER